MAYTKNNILIQSTQAMRHGEGLIIQGCGGDLHEWVDGINDMPAEAGILLEGSKFK